jgi:hypothetical protein
MGPNTSATLPQKAWIHQGDVQLVESTHQIAGEMGGLLMARSGKCDSSIFHLQFWWQPRSNVPFSVERPETDPSIYANGDHISKRQANHE